MVRGKERSLKKHESKEELQRESDNADRVRMKILLRTKVE